MAFYVLLKEYDDNTDDDIIVNRYGPYPERKAEKLDSALNNRIDHEKFYTLVVEAEAA